MDLQRRACVQSHRAAFSKIRHLRVCRQSIGFEAARLRSVAQGSIFRKRNIDAMSDISRIPVFYFVVWIGRACVQSRRACVQSHRAILLLNTHVECAHSLSDLGSALAFSCAGHDWRECHQAISNTFGASVSPTPCVHRK